MKTRHGFSVGLAILLVAINPLPTIAQSHHSNSNPSNGEPLHTPIYDESSSYQRRTQTSPGRDSRDGVIRTSLQNSRSASGPTEDIVRIILVGKSGSGVSSTIRELIGPITQCHKPTGTTETLQDIYEYTISSFPGSNSQIKLVDIPGFVDGRTMEQDSEILATLKSYVTKTGGSFDFLVALSRFDDNRIAGIHSLFVRFLKRVELFNNEFYGKISPHSQVSPIFLLSRLMSITKQEQRRPFGKINEFKRVIDEYSSFPQGYSVIVGDNHAQSDYDVEVQNGYSLLPNKELYPKNVWEAMINSTNSGRLHQVINAMKSNREVEMRCEVKLIETNWDEYSSDADAFLYLLQQESWAVQENEVNIAIEDAFNKLPARADKMNGIIQKTALQVLLQNENFSLRQNLPTSYPARAAFFQKTSITSSKYAAMLLDDAFQLKMPEYINPLTVGYGYDILADEMSTESPFKTDKFIPSQVGYQLPNFIKCRKLVVPESKAFQSYSETMPEYIVERLKHLKHQEDINVTNVEFTGKIVEGFNLPPEDGVNVVTLTAVNEYRTLRCVLPEISQWEDLELSEMFEDTIRTLEPVNLSNMDSIKEWKIFFAKFGTHLVSKGYGGGRLIGNIVGTKLKDVFTSKSTISRTLNSINNFSTPPVANLETPSYNAFGGEAGELNKQSKRLFDLPEGQRRQLIEEWKESLNSNFDMLKTEFTLEKISNIVMEKLGAIKGEMVAEALDLLLRGELKRERRRSNIGSSATTTSNQSQSTTTTRPQSTGPSSQVGSTLVNQGPQGNGMYSGIQPPPSTTQSTHNYYGSDTRSSVPSQHHQYTVPTTTSRPTAQWFASSSSGRNSHSYPHNPNYAQNSASCGNGIKEYGEECEPSEGPCCDNHCRYVISRVTPCKQATECSNLAYCNGGSARCPEPALKANFTPCQHANYLCKNGKCEHSICLIYSLRECEFLTDWRKQGKTGGFCKKACLDRSGACRPVHNLTLSDLPAGFTHNHNVKQDRPCQIFKQPKQPTSYGIPSRINPAQEESRGTGSTRNFQPARVESSTRMNSGRTRQPEDRPFQPINNNYNLKTLETKNSCHLQKHERPRNNTPEEYNIIRYCEWLAARGITCYREY